MRHCKLCFADDAMAWVTCRLVIYLCLVIFLGIHTNFGLHGFDPPSNSGQPVTTWWFAEITTSLQFDFRMENMVTCRRVFLRRR